MQTNLAINQRSTLPSVPTPLDPDKLSDQQLLEFYRDPATGFLDTRGLANFLASTYGANTDEMSARFSAIEKELSTKGTPFDLARFNEDCAIATASKTAESNSGERLDASTVADPSAQQLHQPLGQSLPVLYDSLVRDGYHKQAHANADRFVAKIDELIDRGASQEDIEKVSRQAFDARQSLRTETQNKLTPGGKLVSQAVEQPYTFEDRFQHNANKLTLGNSTPSPEDVLRKVAEGSGKSNLKMDMLAKGGKTFGVVGTAYGLYTAGEAIAAAPANARGKVASEQAGAILGGAGGSILGGAIGAVGIGMLVSNPVGWAVLGASAAGAALVGYAGSEAGTRLGGKLHAWITN